MKVSLGILLLGFVTICRTQTDFDVIMVADVIRTLERPSSIIASLCWSIKKKIQLYTALEGENASHVFMTQFVKLNEIPNRHRQDQHIVFLTDLDCPDVHRFFVASKAENHFRSPFRWIILDSTAGDDSKIAIPEALADIDILPDSEVSVIRRMGNSFYDLNLIYKTGPGRDWLTEHHGYWNIREKFQESGDLIESAALRRLNLNRFEISMCYVLTNPDSINHLTDGINDHIDTNSKANYLTTNHLLDFMNASRKFIFVDTWGYKANGTWNGMTGYLVREEVEIGGSPMFFTSDRASIVDYIASPTPTRSKFVFQQPKLSYENNLFLLSFRTSVWYSSLALVCLLFIAILFVAFWEWKKHSDTYEQRIANTGILRPNPADIAILIFGATCQQGSPVELKGSLGRTVMLVLFLALMFLYTSYSANIVALLQSSSSQIKTLEDLLHSRLKFGVDDVVFNRYYFTTATEPVRKEIYETKIAPPGVKPRFMGMEEGVKKMQKGLFAFHMELGVGYKFVGKYFHEGEKCGLREIQYLQVIDPWLAVRKNSPYKEMFKIGTKRIIEHGLQNRENLLMYEKKPKCSGRGANFVSVSMVDCYPALLVLSYGGIAALFVLALEIIYYRRKFLAEKLCRNIEHYLDK